MKLKIIKYKTLTGYKEIVELPENNYGKYIIYKDKEPSFFVDCFDYKLQSNRLFNCFLLSKGQTIDDVLKKVNKKQGLNLSIEKAPVLEIKVASIIKQVALKPFPLEWLN